MRQPIGQPVSTARVLKRRTTGPSNAGTPVPKTGRRCPQRPEESSAPARDVGLKTSLGQVGQVPGLATPASRVDTAQVQRPASRDVAEEGKLRATAPSQRREHETPNQGKATRTASPVLAVEAALGTATGAAARPIYPVWERRAVRADEGGASISVEAPTAENY